MLLLPPARALLHVLYYPTHTLTCLPLAHLLSHLAHFPHVLPSSLFATTVCASMLSVVPHTCGWQDGLKEENVAFATCASSSTCALLPPHTLTCLPLAHLLSHLAHFPHVLPSSLFATMYSCMASPHSCGPRAEVTPQLWSCCWERGLTRSRRMR